MAVDLNPWVEYEFRVVATNPIGTGDPSTPSRMIRTNEAGKNIRESELFFKRQMPQALEADWAWGIKWSYESRKTYSSIHFKNMLMFCAVLC